MTQSNRATRAEAAARAWTVTIQRVVETATSLIAFGVRFDQPVVLKIVHQRGDEWHGGEVAAAFDGHGIVRVIAHRPGAVLLEQLQPATPLTDVVRRGDDDAACAAICAVIRKMQNAQPRFSDGAAKVEQWGQGFDRYLHTRDMHIDASLVDSARQIFYELSSTQNNPRLLHGDLQHYNILYDSSAGWTAIDPKGVIAEPEFELAAALRNPHGMPELYSDRAVIERRISLMAGGLQLDLQRVMRWAYAQAVLSLIWTVEDDGAVREDEPALLLARALRL